MVNLAGLISASNFAGPEVHPTAIQALSNHKKGMWRVARRVFSRKQPRDARFGMFCEENGRQNPRLSGSLQLHDP